MPKVFFRVVLVLILGLSRVPAAHASGMPTFDVVNATLKELQTALLSSNFAKDFALAMDRLNELKTQTFEMMRFHSGLDEIRYFVRTDPFRDFIGTARGRIREIFSGPDGGSFHLEILQSGGSPEALRASLEAITGRIPEGNQRPYIPFEEMQVVEAFDLAGRIRESGQELRQNAQTMSDQAQSASPKGAARLQAQGVSELMVLGQQNQEAIAKLLELQATQIEQVSRREKEAERERLRFVRDANAYIESILVPRERGLR